MKVISKNKEIHFYSGTSFVITGYHSYRYPSIPVYQYIVCIGILNSIPFIQVSYTFIQVYWYTVHTGILQYTVHTVILQYNVHTGILVYRSYRYPSISFIQVSYTFIQVSQYTVHTGILVYRSYRYPSIPFISRYSSIPFISTDPGILVYRSYRYPTILFISRYPSIPFIQVIGILVYRSYPGILQYTVHIQLSYYTFHTWVLDILLYRSYRYPSIPFLPVYWYTVHTGILCSTINTNGRIS